MKLTYEVFEQYMSIVVRRMEWDAKVHKVMRECPDENAEYYIPPMYVYIIGLLEYIMDDESEWISYWVYELDCGKRYKDGMITDAEGNNIKLKTITDLWAILQPSE